MCRRHIVRTICRQYVRRFARRKKRMEIRALSWIRFYSPKAISRGKWSDNRRYPSRASKKKLTKNRIHVYEFKLITTLNHSLNPRTGTRSDDTFDTRFYGYGISSRRAFTQETVQTLILLPRRVIYQLPSLISSRWAWFNSVDTRGDTTEYDWTALARRKADSHAYNGSSANQVLRAEFQIDVNGSVYDG